MGKVHKLQLKLTRGEKPLQVEELNLIVGEGIKGDAFSGDDENRQLTLMDYQARAKNQDKADGFCLARFTENISLHDLDFSELEVGDKLVIGDAQLEITIAGKKCYPECPVYKRQGNCGLWEKSAFAKVTKSGWIKVGDQALKLSLIHI